MPVTTALLETSWARTDALVFDESAPRPATLCDAVAPGELAHVLAPASALLSVGDPARTRTVYVAIALLVALGLGLVLVAMWLARRTRVDPAVLAPLEVMGQRKWRRSADVQWRQERLDESRPAGAVTLAAIAPLIAADEEAEAAAWIGVFDAPPAFPVEGPIIGPPAPVHALTADELDEILHSFDAPEPGTAVEPAAAVESVDEIDEGADAVDTDDVEAGEETPEEPDDAGPDEVTVDDASAHADKDVDHADAVAGAPDEQPSHG
jgi:hypothetical protein